MSFKFTETTRHCLSKGRNLFLDRCRLRLSLSAGILLVGGLQVAHAQDSNDYVWVGGNQNIIYDSDEGPVEATEYTYTLNGSFTDPTLWGDPTVVGGITPYGQTHGFDYSGGHIVGSFHTVAPGAGDNIYVLGIPDNYAQWVGNDIPANPPGDFPEYGTLEGFYQGSGGFNLTGVTGTVANMTVTGPGTLSLAGINVTGATTLSSIGGIPVVTGYGPSNDYTIFKIDSYAPSAMTVTGGALSTPLLTLTAATDLNPVYNQDTFYDPVDNFNQDENSYVVYPLSQPQTGKPDPIADAGSLTISGATLSGDITQVTPVPSNSNNYLPAQKPTFGIAAGLPGQDPATFNPYSSESFTVSPIQMVKGATLNAKTELDIIGVNSTDFPNATGTVTLSVDASTINAGTVIIATGLGGHGTGQAGSPAELDLADNSTLNAISAGAGPSSIVVGDTGDGVMKVTGSSTIKSQQTVLGNATDATGTVTLDNSTWTNASFFTVGESGTGSLTVTNNATLTSQDVFYFGLNQDGTGTVTVSNGGSIKTQTTGIDGTSSTVIGVVEGSSGTLNVEGSGSKFESQGAMSIGYSGTGEATISDGGSLVVDDTVLRVGRNEGSEGTLTITGSGSSLTQSNGTIYIGYGGEGTVTVESGANMTVEGTDIGGEATGDGELDIMGSGTTADLGDLTVGDAGTGTLNVTDGAVVNTKDITVGAQETDPTINIGSNAQVIADGDMIVGDLGVGLVALTDHATLSVGSITVGSGETGDGTLTIQTNSTVRTSDDVTVAEEARSQGEIDVEGTGSSLTITGDLTIGDAGDGQLTISDNATVSNQGATIGSQADSTGTVEVTGTGSVWHSTGEVTIGDSGSGEVMVDEGGTLRIDGDLTLGKQTGSEGSLTVDGDQSTFTYTGGDVTVGSSGEGTLTVQNGANVDLSGNAITVGDGEEDSDPGTGDLVVTGEGSTLNTGDLTIGGKGAGTLTVDEGGTLISGDSTVADEIDSIGSATVSGSGSTWTTSANLTIGGKGTGELDIEDGGVVTVNGSELVIGDEEQGVGILTLSGSDSKLNVSSDVQIGEDGMGLLAVQGGASFKVHSLVAGDKANSRGTLHVDGAGSLVEVQADFNFGEEGTGTLNVTNSAKVIADSNIAFGDKNGSNGIGIIDSAGSFSATGTLTVGGQSTGTLTLKGGGMFLGNDVVIGDMGGSNGAITVDGALPAGGTNPSSLQFSGELSVGNSGTGTLTVTNGGSVMSVGDASNIGIGLDGSGGMIVIALPFRQIDVGTAAQSSGTVDVAGAGSSIDVDIIVVGDGGAGTFTVENGASTTANKLTILGDKAGGSGNLFVTGIAGGGATNTTLNAGGLEVGEVGSGNLTVSAGATVMASSFRIAGLAGSSGNAFIQDKGSSVQDSGDLFVGNLGMGVLSISGGATVTAVNATLGGVPVATVPANTAGGTGAIAVSGAGSALTLSGDLHVGTIDLTHLTYGSGTLQVLNGAAVTNQNAIIDGVLSNGATVKVSGAGSTWQTKGDLVVGQNIAGTVTVDMGAAMTVDGNLTLGQNIDPTSTINLGQSAGNIFLDGAGTTLNQNGTSTVIGMAGTGLISVTGGAQATFAGSVVDLGQNSASAGTTPGSTVAGGHGSLFVGDNNSNDTNTQISLNSLVVGDGGSGNVQIENGAKIISNSNVLTVAKQAGSSGEVTIDGTYSNLSLNSHSTATVGLGGSGTFNVEDGAAFFIDNFVLGENGGASGTANINGTGAAGGSSLNFDDKLIVGDSGTGTLNITAGGSVVASGNGAGQVAVGAQNGVGTVTVDGATSQLKATSLLVGGRSASPGQGTVTVKNGANVYVSSSVEIGANSSVNVEGDTVNTSNGPIPIAGNGGGVTIGANTQTATAGEVLVNKGGSLGGAGQVEGNVVANGGTIAPGDPQTLTVEGNVTILAGSTLQLQLAGTNSVDYDHLDVTGTFEVDAGATLQLEFIQGFAPQKGDVFDFINAGATAPGDNMFSNVDITGLAAGFDYSITSDGNGGYDLTALNNAVAAPEPSVWIMMLSGLGILIFVRRRKA